MPNGNILLSGCRGGILTITCRVCLFQSVNSAHKDWICGLQFMPSGNILLSGCRGGYLKLWNVENCQPLGEIRAHTNPINAIATNSTAIFTASKYVTCFIKFSHGLTSWYPLAIKVVCVGGGVYPFQQGCLSVHPSVENVVPTPLLHYLLTYKQDTSHMCWP